MICAYLKPRHDVDEEPGVENTYRHSLAIFAFRANFFVCRFSRMGPGWVSSIGDVGLIPSF